MLQRELLLFFSNLEILMQSHAIRSHCDEFDKLLDDFVKPGEDYEKGNYGGVSVDMDSLVELHNTSIRKILESCLIRANERKT
jgi:hypothetical protein